MNMNHSENQNHDQNTMPIMMSSQQGQQQEQENAIQSQEKQHVSSSMKADNVIERKEGESEVGSEETFSGDNHRSIIYRYSHNTMAACSCELDSDIGCRDVEKKPVTRASQLITPVMDTSKMSTQDVPITGTAISKSSTSSSRHEHASYLTMEACNCLFDQTERETETERGAEKEPVTEMKVTEGVKEKNDHASYSIMEPCACLLENGNGNVQVISVSEEGIEPFKFSHSTMGACSCVIGAKEQEQTRE